MINQFSLDLKRVFPVELVNSLLDSYVEIKTNFITQKWEPSELNGGKFVEATVRVLQHVIFGSYTPIGASIRNMYSELQRIESSPPTFLDSYRLHIPRCLGAIYNIRNRRGVGHLSGDINPNKADALLIITIAEWILAELYRINYNIDLQEAQDLVDKLVSRKLELVFEFNGIKRILNHKLSIKDKVLLIAYSGHNPSLSLTDLCLHLKYQNQTYLKTKVLKILDRIQYIELTADNRIFLLPPGKKYVEDNYENWKP